MTKLEVERASKYWICDECATAKKWRFPVGNVTVIKGLCGHCERTDEVFLTPTIDFNRPGGKPWD